ncbi:MAG: hypothetical protein ACI4KR_08825 [Ruminiclostridium sp.]
MKLFKSQLGVLLLPATISQIFFLQKREEIFFLQLFALNCVHVVDNYRAAVVFGYNRKVAEVLLTGNIYVFLVFEVLAYKFRLSKADSAVDINALLKKLCRVQLLEGTHRLYIFAHNKHHPIVNNIIAHREFVVITRTGDIRT